jgi:hypothetical protein
MGISDDERERIYRFVFAGCGENFAPCIVCNQDGRLEPGDDMEGEESIIRDLW